MSDAASVNMAQVASMNLHQQSMGHGGAPGGGHKYHPWAAQGNSPLDMPDSLNSFMTQVPPELEKMAEGGMLRAVGGMKMDFQQQVGGDFGAGVQPTEAIRAVEIEGVGFVPQAMFEGVEFQSGVSQDDGQKAGGGSPHDGEHHGAQAHHDHSGGESHHMGDKPHADHGMLGEHGKGDSGILGDHGRDPGNQQGNLAGAGEPRGANTSPDSESNSAPQAGANSGGGNQPQDRSQWGSFMNPEAHQSLSTLEGQERKSADEKRAISDRAQQQRDYNVPKKEKRGNFSPTPTPGHTGDGYDGPGRS